MSGEQSEPGVVATGKSSQKQKAKSISVAFLTSIPNRMRIVTPILIVLLVSAVLTACLSSDSDKRSSPESTINVRQPETKDRCELPIVLQRKVSERYEYEMAGEDGRMYSIVTTKYQPTERIEFVPTLTRAQTESGMKPTAREIEWFNESSFKGKVFAVEIFGRDLTPEGGNSNYRQLWKWRCVAIDGDGLFEYPTGKRLFVPVWVTK